MATRRPRRRRTRRGCGTALALAAGLVVLAAAAVWGVVALLDRGPAPVDVACHADVDGTDWRLSPEQVDNAALISAITVRRGLPARAATIALATALQESKLVNLDYGHLDSLGLFQQRPSQGWGTREQVTDPVYATGTFLDHLVRVPGWNELPITEAAQAVQRSAFPDAYAQHEGRARAFASALTGYSRGALTCALEPADGAGSADAVLARATRDWGELPSSALAANDAAGVAATVTLDAAGLAPDDPARAGWALAQWAVALAQPLALDRVQVSDQAWVRDTDGWAATPAVATLAPGTVVLTLAR